MVGALSTLRNLVSLCIPLTIFFTYETVRKSQSLRLFLAMFGTIVAIHITQALLRFVRLRAIRRLAGDFETAYREPAYGPAFSQSPARKKMILYIRDVDRISSLILGNGFVALFDLPWIAVYLALLARVDVWLAGLSVVFSTIIATAALIDQRQQQKSVAAADSGDLFQLLSSEGGLHRAFMPRSRFQEAYSERRHKYYRTRWIASLVPDSLRVSSQAVKSIQIVVMLGAASYLTVEFSASIGTMMIVAFLAPRISDPLDTFIRSWNEITAARRSWRRVRETRFDDLPLGSAPELPALPVMHVEDLVIRNPSDGKVLLSNISFDLGPGDVLTVIGGSGCGKTALANTLAGCWSPKAGIVSLGGTAVAGISDEKRTEILGYLPQEIGFYFGTVAENISRFSSAIDQTALDEVLARVGLDRLWRDVGDGVNTPIKEIVHFLSPGNRKKVAIARAFYGLPQYVVLDEPMVNLDDDGIGRLKKLLGSHRQRGGITVLLTANSHQTADLIVGATPITKSGANHSKLLDLSALR